MNEGETNNTIVKYEWHDLRKNPKDFPEQLNFLAVKENNLDSPKVIKHTIKCGNYLYDGDDAEIEEWFCGSIDMNDDSRLCVERGNCFVMLNAIVAWKYIEPFEGGD